MMHAFVWAITPKSFTVSPTGTTSALGLLKNHLPPTVLET